MTDRTIAPAADEESLELDRIAYNAAFYDLRLSWYWDCDTFARLQEFPDSASRVRRYIETQHPHLLRAYDPEFLAQAIETAKAEHRRTLESHPGSHLPARDRVLTCAAELGA